MPKAWSHVVLDFNKVVEAGVTLEFVMLIEMVDRMKHMFVDVEHQNEKN